MIRTILRGALAAVVVGLAACGGGTDTCVDVAGGNACGGGGGGGGGSTPVASDLVLVLDSASITNTGTDSVAIAVTALDANRNALAAAPVTVAADSNAVVTLDSSDGVTNDSGVLSGSVAIGSDTSLRTITVTATSGSVTRTAVLSVVAGSGTRVPALVELVADATSVGTSGNSVLLTAFVKDANNNTMPSTAVTFTTSTGTLSNVSTSTNASGAATAQFSAGSDKSNRTAVITVTSGAISQQLSLPINGSKLSVSGASSLTLGSVATFTVTAEDSVGNPLANATIAAVSSLGNTLTPATATTDSLGQAKFDLTASASGGEVISFSGFGASVSAELTISSDTFSFVSPAAATTVNIGDSQTVSVRYLVGGVAQSGKRIDFAATGGTLTASSAITNASGLASVSISSTSAGPVTVQATVEGATASATLPLTFVATVPAKLVLQVAQASLAPNPVGSAANNRTQVIAKVLDINDNPVPKVVVNFQRVSDPSGGSLLDASSKTDDNGQAQVTYVSGPESTASNGVVLQASVANDLAISGTATLTVNQTALFITLGTGNVIGNIDEQTYKKDWVVYVTDANGVAVSGVTLTMKALPTDYLRGHLVQGDNFWVYEAPILICPTEDDNANGTLDPGEDDNGDGVLWPGNVVAVSPGTVTTDSTGRATVSLLYAENLAPWVRVKLTASARVSGTESRRDAEFIVTGSTDDFVTSNVPAGVNSPFGDFLPLTEPEVASCKVY